MELLMREVEKEVWVARESRKYWSHYWFYTGFVLIYSLIYFPFIDNTIVVGDFMDTYIYAMCGIFPVCFFKLGDFNITENIYNEYETCDTIVYIATLIYLLHGLGRVLVNYMPYVLQATSVKAYFDLSLLSMFGYIFIIFVAYSIGVIQDPKEYYQ